MARTHAWLLHTRPASMVGPRERGLLQRLQAWFLALWRSKTPALCGPVETSSLEELGAALEHALGSRYRFLVLNPRPGPSLDEALRELLDTDRVVLIPPMQASPRRARSLKRRAERILSRRGRPCTCTEAWERQQFLTEAIAWSHRMKQIALLKSQACFEPPPIDSPVFRQGLAETIRQAERDAGWRVPEDWVRQAVAQAWSAIDEGQSVEAATTLPEEASGPGFVWMDELLKTDEDER